jgi:hypothetical protein
MKIANVKLVNDGLKGIEVSYLGTSKKDNREFNDEYKVKYTAPIHKELRVAFSKLRFHLIHIFKLRSFVEAHLTEDYQFKKQDLPKPDKAYLQAKDIWDSVIVSGVTSNGIDTFLVTGKLKCFGNLITAINSPLIKEDAGYAYFSEAIEVVDEIYAEIEKYISGAKVADDSQIVMDFYKSKGQEEKLEEVQTYSPEQMKAEAIQLLENMGGLVMMPEDRSETPEMTVSAGGDDEEITIPRAEKFKKEAKAV